MINHLFFSVIRPWKLLPEVQRLSHSVKTDPVALYQKYQKEWNQISFPGENHHADVRWAVREKMLGTDPTPRVKFPNKYKYL